MDIRSPQRARASLTSAVQRLPSPSLIPVPFACMCLAKKNSQEFSA
ncbi:hypothetical protein C8K61_10594 [Pseudomonas sp. GV071]|nr:hypothetical protein C8K61_10594 [Pseudomonas sp. GV071]